MSMAFGEGLAKLNPEYIEKQKRKAREKEEAYKNLLASISIMANCCGPNDPLWDEVFPSTKTKQGQILAPVAHDCG